MGRRVGGGRLWVLLGTEVALACGVAGLLQRLSRALAPASSQGTGMVGPGRGRGRVGMERGIPMQGGSALALVSTHR